MGTDEHDISAKVQFAQPPVRQVDLILYLETSQPIQAWHVARLRDRWKADYPDVTERPPVWAGEGPGGIDFAAPAGAWPMPYTRYENPAAGRAISFQNDRFEIEWSFLGDEATYPGFDALIDELGREFDQFTETILLDGEVGVSVTRAECRYENAIEGMSGSELAVGILTGWSGASPGVLVENNRYVGVRLHSCPDRDVHDCSSWLSVDGEGSDDAVLTLTVSWPSKKSDRAGIEGLHEAHAELIDQFVRYTSESLQKRWGRIS